MKSTLSLLFLLTFFSGIFAQSPQWAWLKGQNTYPGWPVYGNKGVAAAANKPAGRKDMMNWMDASGNLWCFGGNGYAVTGGGSERDFNDLWKYAPSTGLWTWVSGDTVENIAGVYGTKGIASPIAKPGAREGGLHCTDAEGNLWLFGGLRVYQATNGYVAEYYNDLWKYSPASGLWTWISGDSTVNQPGIYGMKGIPNNGNKPGGRRDAVCWMDAAGKFWLFGGLGYPIGGNPAGLNDLWKFDPADGRWTWVSGDFIPNQLGVYGTIGQPAAANKPGARDGAVSWKDTAGNLWMHGGEGFGSTSTLYGGGLNDLWKYTLSTGQWTWVSGSTTQEALGIYGTKRIADFLNMPGARYGAVGITDSVGSFWLFGGYGKSGTGNGGHLNDLWKYSVSSGQWTWVSGDNADNTDNYAPPAGIYGTRGIAAPGNKPGSRQYASGWFDAGGKLWLLGGTWQTGSYGAVKFNDLWSFNTLSAQWTWINGDNREPPGSIFGVKGIPSADALPGARYASHTWTDTSGNMWLFSGTGYALNDLWKLNPSTAQWTWMSGDSSGTGAGNFGTLGVPSTANQPQARSNGSTSQDSKGNLWLFGGRGFSSSSVAFLNDLWKYDINTGLWTWMGGSKFSRVGASYGIKGIAAASNMPATKDGACAWTDTAGNFWLFGGNGFTYAVTNPSFNGSFNDLWKFSPASGLWTWVSGDNIPDQRAVFGVKGVPAATNKPGAGSGTTWTDLSGNLWLLGGGSGSSVLWKFDVSTGWWTYMTGSTGINITIYGVKGVPAPDNMPGLRSHAVSWTDSSGDLWMFGGSTSSPDLSDGYLNELWKYTMSTGMWTWVSGDNTPFSFKNGVYGEQGISSPGNRPGARQSPSNWKDKSGRFWLFGGIGLLSNGKTATSINDFWVSAPALAALPLVFSSLSARKQQETVILEWTTAQEQNSCCFIVERSASGAIFDSIGTVNATGTTAASTAYSFTDNNPLPGINLYRIKSLDFDGRFMYSGVVKVATDEAALQFHILQNPVQSMLKLGLQLPSSLQLTLQIRDINGHLLQTEERRGNKGKSMIQVAVHSLVKGTYLINVRSGNYSNTKIFIKQ